MKKIVYIFIALLAFATGIFVVHVRPYFVAISLYDLRGNIGKYKYQHIKVKGYFVAEKEESGDYYYHLRDFSDHCIADNYVCNVFIGLELPEKIKESEVELINEIAEKNRTLGKEKGFFEGSEYGAQVEILGYIDEKTVSLFSHCCPPHIEVKEIKQISAVELIKPRGKPLK